MSRYLQPKTPGDQINKFKPGLIPVEGMDGWFRDPDSLAVINCNATEYENYMAAYNKRIIKDEKLNTLQTEISGLKSDLGDIKNLLKSLVNGENK